MGVACDPLPLRLGNFFLCFAHAVLCGFYPNTLTAPFCAIPPPRMHSPLSLSPLPLPMLLPCPSLPHSFSPHTPSQAQPGSRHHDDRAAAGLMVTPAPVTPGGHAGRVTPLTFPCHTSRIRRICRWGGIGGKGGEGGHEGRQEEGASPHGPAGLRWGSGHGESVRHGVESQRQGGVRVPSRTELCSHYRPHLRAGSAVRSDQQVRPSHGWPQPGHVGPHLPSR